MDELEILEGNKKICDFMNILYKVFSWKNHKSLVPEWWDFDNDLTEYNFHLDYSLLMDVIEKIEHTPYPDLTFPRVTIDTRFIRINDIEVFVADGDRKSFKIWECILKYIDNGNKTSSSSKKV